MRLRAGQPETCASSSDFFAEVEILCFADLCPQIRNMASRSPARVALMFAGLLAFLAAITFNTLSGFGAKSGAYFTSFDSEAGEKWLHVLVSSQAFSSRARRR